VGKRARKSSPRSAGSSKKRARRVRQAESVPPVIPLFALARVLTECEKAGIHPKLKHGIIFTDVGYVLPIKDDEWAARPLKKSR
jgi:hypothetical protein